MSWIKSPRHIPLSKVRIEKSEGHLIARSLYWEIYEGTYGCTSVAALCYRQSSRTNELWAATVYYIDQILDTIHPNLIQVIGLVYDIKQDTESLPLWLLFEKCPRNLFELLHVKKLPLLDIEIVQIAIDIVKVIIFCDDQGLRHLTSRKILLENTSHVKILGLYQRDILEMANAPLIPTLYLPPLTASAQNIDIYSFGVLLWEMCCREKPTVELFTRIAQVRVERPQLQFAEDMIRACTHEDPLLRPSPQQVLDELLVVFQKLQTSPAIAINISLPPAPEDLTNVQTIKRLEAVENQVLEEQRNFDIVVGQLEFATSEITSLQKVLASKCQEFNALKTTHEQDFETINCLNAQVYQLKEVIFNLEKKTAQLENDNQHLEHQYQQLKEHGHKTKLDHDAMNSQVRSLHEEMKKLTLQLQKANQRIDEEKDISDELNVRWQQTIKLCQQETLLKEKGEQLVTHLRNENRELRDQLHNWHPDTGVFALQRQKDIVNEINDHIKIQTNLKDEIATLKEQIYAKDKQFDVMTTQQLALEANQLELATQIQETQTAKVTIENILHECQNKYQELQSDYTTQKNAYITLEHEYNTIQEKLVAEIKQRQDEEIARKSRRCLDLSCDAPPFLIQQSGYCKDHHEKREREKAEKLRLLEEATRLKPPDELVAESFKKGGISSVLSLLQTYHDSIKIIGAIVKKLQNLCELQVEYKNQLGDFNGFKALVDIAAEYKSQDIFQLQLVRLFGVAAFNHNVNRVRLVSEGALDIIVAAMTTFPDHLQLQQTSCTALTNLAHNCEGNRHKIFEKGALERILDAMQHFPRDKSLQECACWALISLAGSDHMCKLIAGRGGLGAILAGMLNCPGEASVQYYGIWALLNLVTGVDTLQHFAVQEGVVEVCEAAMACHTDHIGIQDKAQCLLDMLLDNQGVDEQ
ncbi:hypothetical protein THRCLA_03359 [Thraustotheca clavata]|uniref:Protein kinase domain-containing protein n=1 Tax=Thraustotheca clavata TaxID=74557 RepID=A0A1W0A2J5_9STRA|nr:hypothetical protein THRCLA_03359 [Thraustotheca clavata]